MEMTEHGRDEGLDRKSYLTHGTQNLPHLQANRGKDNERNTQQCRKIETVSSSKATQHVNMHLMLICTYSRLCAEIQLMTAAEKTTNQWKQ